MDDTADCPSKTVKTGPDSADRENFLPDSDIVALFFARDERAVEESRAKYGGWCLAAAENILSSREDAEECVNDALLRAWNAIPPERPLYLGAFLAAIVRRLALDRYRAETAEKRGGCEVRLCLDELAEAVGAGGGVGAGEAERSAGSARTMAAFPVVRRAAHLPSAVLVRISAERCGPSLRHKRRGGEDVPRSVEKTAAGISEEGGI